MPWLRDNACDIRKYLPDFLLTEDDFNNLLIAESSEHDKQRLTIADLLEQMFIETETWALGRWESIIGITAHPTDTYAERRNRIMLYLKGRQTSTVEFLTSLAKRYIDGGETSIIEDNPEYMFELKTSGSVTDSKGLLEALDTYKPAHLGYKIIIKFLFDLSEEDRIFYGIAHLTNGKKYINIPHPERFGKTLFVGVGYARTGISLIGIDAPERTEITAYAGTFTVRNGRIQIGGIR